MTAPSLDRYLGAPVKTLALASVATLAALTVVGYAIAADTANKNLSKAADNFEVQRRIVGINGITDHVLFTVEGYCSLTNDGMKLDVLCKVNNTDVERTTLGLSDNVTYVSTQIGGKKVSFYRPRIIFRPATVVPNFDLGTG